MGFSGISSSLPTLVTTKSGGYAQGQFGVTTATLGNGNLRISPIIITDTIVIKALGSEFSVAGDASSIFNLTCFKDDNTGYPGSLVSNPGSISTGTGNAGTIPTGGVPGVYLAPLPVPLVFTPGIWWLGGVVQGVTVTQPTMAIGYFSEFIPTSSVLPSLSQSNKGYFISGITGAIPTLFPAWNTVNAAGAAPRMVFQVQ